MNAQVASGAIRRTSADDNARGSQRKMPSLAEPIRALFAIANGNDVAHNENEKRNGHSNGVEANAQDKMDSMTTQRNGVLHQYLLNESYRLKNLYNGEQNQEHFYVCENIDDGQRAGRTIEDEEYFAGNRELGDVTATKSKENRIISAKGTVRGVRNRVRAGIATFRESQHNEKYSASEKGRVIVYTTSMMIVRDTHEKCNRVRNILQTHMVTFEERDLFMSRENQRELMERLGVDVVVDVPHVFGDGQYMGGAEELEALNEMGELRTIFKHFKREIRTASCGQCGGYRYVPCHHCHGSKKSVHRNHYTTEFCALRCILCDENGLLRCTKCNAGNPSSQPARLGGIYEDNGADTNVG